MTRQLFPSPESARFKISGKGFMIRHRVDGLEVWMNDAGTELALVRQTTPGKEPRWLWSEYVPDDKEPERDERPDVPGVATPARPVSERTLRARARRHARKLARQSS